MIVSKLSSFKTKYEKVVIQMGMIQLKTDLKMQVNGKVMIRQDRSYKGLELRGIYSYNVYYDIPTDRNKELITRLIKENGFNPHGHRVIGGNYGYVVSFNTDVPKEEPKPAPTVDSKIEEIKAAFVEKNEKMALLSEEIERMAEKLKSLRTEYETTMQEKIELHNELIAITMKEMEGK